MGTAILRSHDCLQGRFLHNEAFAIAASRVASRRNSNPNNNSFASSAKPNRCRKRSPVTNRDRRRSPAKATLPANLVMGHVKILKRGEKLSLQNNTNQRLAENVSMKNDMGLDLLLGSTDRLGPDPLTMQKHIRVSDANNNGVYAGSAFVSSPHPSSVPVPGFLGRNGAATSDLRRLLRLDLEWYYFGVCRLYCVLMQWLGEDGWWLARMVSDALPLFFQEDSRRVRAREEETEKAMLEGF